MFKELKYLKQNMFKEVKDFKNSSFLKLKGQLLFIVISNTNKFS